MKKIVLFAIGLLLTARVAAQIPYYAGTVGDGKLYGYTSVKFRPGANRQETYSTFQYGLGNHLATGIDLYTGPNCAYWGALVRYGHKLSKWMNVGGEVMSSFDLNDSFRFGYLTTGLYMNGALSSDSRLFWCSNSWWVATRGARATYSNYEYLGYNIPLSSHRSLTPMVGAVHSWRFDDDVQPAAGFYYTAGAWTLYAWCHDFLHAHPRMVLGLEFIL